jgi:hypothetical protein
MRLRNRARVYDFFQRMANDRDERPAVKLIPYSGASTKRTFGLDSVAYPGFGKRLAPGQTHAMNGSTVTLWYKAAHKPTAEQIKKAEYATKVLKIHRQRYTGKLVDVFLHNGTLYTLLAGVLERDREGGKHQCNFRMFNLEDGDLYVALVDEVAKVRNPNAIKTISPKTKAKTKV